MQLSGRSHASIPYGAVAICLLALSSAAGCGQAKSNDGSGVSAAGAATTSAGAPASAAGASNGGTPGNQYSGQAGLPQLNVDSGGASQMSGSSGSGGACAATFVKAESQTLAMFIMLDQSRSMDNIVDPATMTTRWTAVTSALDTFVSNPAAAAIPVGLQYFGLQGPQTTTGPGVACMASDYAKADVPIAPLSSNARSITASMAMHSPTTNTPTLPAVEGGVQFVAGYARAHPENKVVLVLATDGVPDGCGSTVMNVSAAAAAGLAGTPSVETYVIGVGNSLSNLDAIAVAGGTKHAFLIGDANVQQELLMALTAIQGDVLPCQYAVPSPEKGETLDFDKVNVRFTPSGGTGQQEFQKVVSAAGCTGSKNLWYYDNEAAPTQILLCPETCTMVTSDGMAKVDIVLDCKHTVEPPK